MSDGRAGNSLEKDWFDEEVKHGSAGQMFKDPVAAGLTGRILGWVRADLRFPDPSHVPRRSTSKRFSGSPILSLAAKRHVMVYVALGLLIASSPVLFYIYKGPRWSVTWSVKWSTPWTTSWSTHGQPAPGIEVGLHQPGGSPSGRNDEQAGFKLPVLAENDVAHSSEQSNLEDMKESQPPQGPKEANGHLPKPAVSQDAGGVSIEGVEKAELQSFFNKPQEATKTAMQTPARPGPRLRPKANNLMPPPSTPKPRPTGLGVPPITSSSLRPLPTGGSSSLRPPPSAASSLRAPPSPSPTTSTLPSSQRPSRKVILEPGHSPLDWAHLTKHPPTPTYLRGADVPRNLIRVPPSLLRHHNGRKGKNAWGVWQGKVYNLSPYLKFHPGGVDQLMKGAGREKDGERLFLEVHPWVNWEGLLGECLVGILVSEQEGAPIQGEGEEGGGLEEMD